MFESIWLINTQVSFFFEGNFPYYVSLGEKLRMPLNPFILVFGIQFFINKIYSFEMISHFQFLSFLFYSLFLFFSLLWD